MFLTPRHRCSLRASAVVGLFLSFTFCGSRPTDAQRGQVPPQIGTGTGSISGRVYDSDLKAPVSGAILTLLPNRTDPPFGANQPALKTKTRSDGTYMFSAVAEGEYAIQIEASGYPTQLKQLAEPLKSGQQLRHVDIELPIRP
jgi:hypothetical protein